MLGNIYRPNVLQWGRLNASDKTVKPCKGKALFDRFYAIARREIAQFLCDCQTQNCPVTAFHNQAKTPIQPFYRDFVELRAVSSRFSKEDWDKRLQRPGTDVQNFKQPSPPPSSSHHHHHHHHHHITINTTIIITSPSPPPSSSHHYYQSPSSSRAAGRRLLVSRSRHSVLSDSSHFF